jgi:hypothetical protein
MNPFGEFSYGFFQNNFFDALELDAMHASLPDLKYRPSFLLNLFIV